MPLIRDAGGNLGTVPEREILQALQTGQWWQGAQGASVAMISPEGERLGINFDPREIQARAQQGYRFEDQKEEQYAWLKHNSDAPVSAFALGALRGLTLGASDWALSKTGLLSDDQLAAYAEVNPSASFAGEIVGAVAPAFATGGAGVLPKIGTSAAKGILARTPAGLLATGGARLEASLAAKLGKGAIREAAAKGIALGAEGGLYAGGQAILSDPVLTGQPLVAEQVLTHVGLGALTGALMGGATSLIGSGVGAAAGGLKRVFRKPSEPKNLWEAMGPTQSVPSPSPVTGPLDDVAVKPPPAAPVFATPVTRVEAADLSKRIGDLETEWKAAMEAGDWTRSEAIAREHAKAKLQEFTQVAVPEKELVAAQVIEKRKGLPEVEMAPKSKFKTLTEIERAAPQEIYDAPFVAVKLELETGKQLEYVYKDIRNITNPNAVKYKSGKAKKKQPKIDLTGIRQSEDYAIYRTGKKEFAAFSRGDEAKGQSLGVFDDIADAEAVIKSHVMPKKTPGAPPRIDATRPVTPEDLMAEWQTEMAAGNFQRAEEISVQYRRALMELEQGTPPPAQAAPVAETVPTPIPVEPGPAIPLPEGGGGIPFAEPAAGRAEGGLVDVLKDALGKVPRLGRVGEAAKAYAKGGTEALAPVVGGFIGYEGAEAMGLPGWLGAGLGGAVLGPMLAARAAAISARAAETVLENRVTKLVSTAVKGAMIATGKQAGRTLNRVAWEAWAEDGELRSRKHWTFKKGDQQETFNRVLEAVHTATNPEVFVAAMQDRFSNLANASPALMARISATAAKAYQHLRETAPKAATISASETIRGLQPKVSPTEIREWFDRVEVAFHGLSVLVDRLSRGSLTPQMIETAQVVYPESYGKLVSQIGVKISERAKRGAFVDRRFKIQMAMMGIALDNDLRTPAQMSVFSRAGNIPRIHDKMLTIKPGSLSKITTSYGVERRNFATPPNERNQLRAAENQEEPAL